MAEQSPIADFFIGRHVFITGGTGFMGKVLVEKLLRSCPGVGNIYLLMRSKRGCDVRTRLDELLNATLFDGLRKERPDALKNVIAISGDVTHAELGISPQDQKTLIEDVSIVFHSAATVKFDEALKLSVAMNLVGTKRLVQLCHKMTKLEALVHVSTAYCYSDRQEINELAYPAPADPEKIIQCVDWLSDDLLETITPKLIGNQPNNYTFTKALAEHVLIDNSGNLPTAIVRPSIVTAAWKEPIPGWVDNLNGPTGLFVGAGKGVLRTLICNGDLVADLIPVDTAINLLITVAWHTATARPNNILIYNCTSGNINPILWRDLESMGHTALVKHPLNDVLWYPGGSFKTSRFLNGACVLAFQVLPAHVIDLCKRITGKKPIMVRLQHRLQRAIVCLEYFTTHEWRFSNANVTRLLGQLSQRDRKEFDFDVSKLVWRDYMEDYVLGAKRFVLKEDISTIPAARRHMRKMYFVHRCTQVLSVLIAWRVLIARSSTARRIFYMIMSLVFYIVKSIPSLVRVTL